MVFATLTDITVEQPSVYSKYNPTTIHHEASNLGPAVDDRQWSWYYLRKQFKIRNLEGLYLQYQQRLHRGYFSVFLLLQMILSIVHAAVLLGLESENPARHLLPDVSGYIAIALTLWPLVALVFKQRLVQRYCYLPLLISCTSIVILLSIDLLLPIYHTLNNYTKFTLRPAYGTHALLACYIFLPLQNNKVPFLLGSVVTAAHLGTIAFISYLNENLSLRQLGSDTVYLTCVNILGMYFRLVNEVFIRRTFLDRRACVESTLKLNYEKEQEEQLMLSILPRHVASRVRDDIRKQVSRAGYSEPLFTKKPFNELYVEQHRNVSILYADVVNYTAMTTSLPASTLVATLNELFGRFDEASERHNVLRIKFLGDCYYCVAGVPTPNPDHARSCVNLGLEMISIIKEVREQRKLDIDMRIGIHSGNILSGLLGHCKWQYDVWSKDVIIANRMEQSGQAGMVHITKQTLNLLGGGYVIEPGYGHLKDDLLAKYNIETFLICPSKQIQLSSSGDIAFSSVFDKRKSSGVVENLHHCDAFYKLKKISNNGKEIVIRRRTTFMDNNLYMYQQRLKMADVHMARAIEKLPLGKYDQWFHKEQLHPLCLTFQVSDNWELPFLRQPDPLFKYYVGSSIMVLIGMLLIQILSLQSWHWVAWAGFITSAALLLFLIPITWSHVAWHAWRDPHQEMDSVPAPKSPVLRVFYKASLCVIYNAWLRTALYLLICFLLTSCAIADLVDCASATSTTDESTVQCVGAWQMTEACSLAVLISFLFLRIHFQLKLAVGLIILCIYSWCVWNLKPDVFEKGGTWNPDLEPRLAHILSMVFLVFGLHLMDRQAEYMNRLDYRWKRQLSAEKEEASMTRVVNKMLLQNILPIHVAEVYLNSHREANELYHENYECAAVMFATLTNYSLLDNADKIQGELRSLQILNQIICTFDNKLFSKPFRRVEKIKVAGWTYLAACGLDPGRRTLNSTSAVSQQSDDVDCGGEQFLLTLVAFAVEVMKTLRSINRTFNTNFKLRVGIAHGPITAGVVGSQKPLYDIWGNAVNLASRMDSTGESGKIQVPEMTASVLMQQGVNCQLRGQTLVKGIGLMPTYFVTVADELKLI